MKTKLSILALTLAAVSINANADFDKLIAASKYDVKQEAKERVEGDKHLQSQLNNKVDASAFNKSQAQQNEHINAVQDAAQQANSKADNGAVRMDGIESNLANTDDRSINNAVRLDGVEKTNAVQDVRLDKTNQRVDAVAYTTNSNTKRLGNVEKNVAVNTSDIVTLQEVTNNHTQQINTNTSTLNNHGGRISTLEDYSRDMDTRLSGRLDSQQSEINSLKRDVKQVKSMAAVALAVAGHQFSTDQSAGVQMALSGSTIAGAQAVALGVGGAVSDNLFFNAAVSTSSGVTGGVVSSTYRFK